MPGEFVRSWETQGTGGTGTLSIPNAVPNNLLVAFTFGREADAATVDPKWTLLEEASRSASPYGYTGVWYKIADGDDDFVATYNWPSTLYVIQAVEYQGLLSDQGTILDGSNFNEEFGVPSSTSIFTNTATPGQANGLSIVGVSIYDQSGWNTTINHPGNTVDSGYTARPGFDNANSNGPSVRFADKVYADLLAKSATWSTTGTGSRNFAFVANFKEPSGAPEYIASGTGNSQNATGSGVADVTPPQVDASGAGNSQPATGSGVADVTPPQIDASGTGNSQNATGSGVVEVTTLDYIASGTGNSQSATGSGAVDVTVLDYTASGTGNSQNATGFGIANVTPPQVDASGSGDSQSATGFGAVDVTPAIEVFGVGNSQNATGSGFAGPPAEGPYDLRMKLPSGEWIKLTHVESIVGLKELVSLLVSAGYGGIFNTPGQSLPNITTTPQIVPFDQALLPNPHRISYDFASDAMIFNSVGIWRVNAVLALEHNSISNAGRQMVAQLYDLDADEPRGAGLLYGIGRNTTVTTFVFSVLVDLPANRVGNRIVLRLFTQGDTFSSVILDSASFDTNHVSEYVEG